MVKNPLVERKADSFDVLGMLMEAFDGEGGHFWSSIFYGFKRFIGKAIWLGKWFRSRFRVEYEWLQISRQQDHAKFEGRFWSSWQILDSQTRLKPLWSHRCLQEKLFHPRHSPRYDHSENRLPWYLWSKKQYQTFLALLTRSSIEDSCLKLGSSTHEDQTLGVTKLNILQQNHLTWGLYIKSSRQMTMILGSLTQLHVLSWPLFRTQASLKFSPCVHWFVFDCRPQSDQLMPKR